MTFRVLVAFAFLLTPSVAQTSSAIPIVSVCEIMDSRPTYNEQTVVVVGRLSGSSEGSWLDADCSYKLVENGREWPTTISLAYTMAQHQPSSFPKGFSWNDRLLLNKVEELKSMTSLHAAPQYHYREEWAAVFGRFESHPLRNRADGYGHLNGSPAQLIWPEKGIHVLHARNQRWLRLEACDSTRCVDVSGPIMLGL